MLRDFIIGLKGQDSHIQQRIVEYALSPRTFSTMLQVCTELRDMDNFFFRLANESMFGFVKVRAPLSSSRKLYQTMVDSFSEDFYNPKRDSFACEHEFVDSAEDVLTIFHLALHGLDSKCPCCASAIVLPDILSKASFVNSKETKAFFSRGLPECKGAWEKAGKPLLPSPALIFKCEQADCGYGSVLEFTLKIPYYECNPLTFSGCLAPSIDRFLGGEEDWYYREPEAICAMEGCGRSHCRWCVEERGFMHTCNSCSLVVCNACSHYCEVCGATQCSRHRMLSSGAITGDDSVIKHTRGEHKKWGGGPNTCCEDCQDEGWYLSGGTSWSYGLL